jgi:hypothetical protein
MMRQIAPRSVLYYCDRKPLAVTIVHSNGAVYTSLINLTLYLLYEVRVFFCVTRPPHENTAKTRIIHRLLLSLLSFIVTTDLTMVNVNPRELVMVSYLIPDER